ncbi:hypothetical protein SLS55_010387 [Diplodia seriata]|uniref:F-box domain-containing protein n=1 Tax=Diplodia seriata TaxID=420778 RepID=A0ABR3BYD6_9PEZI
MPELPEDALFLIVKELNLLHRREMRSPPPTLLSQYAGVGRTWNAIIERKTFSHLRVYSPGHQRPITPARFKQLMDRDPARWDALSTVSFYASYPIACNSERGRSEAGKAVNNAHFSSSVREFWKVLKTLDAHEGKARDLLFSTLQVPNDNIFVPGGDAYLHLVGEPLPHLGRCISQTPTSCTDFSAEFGYSYSGFDEMLAVAPSTADTLCIQLRSLSMCLRHLNLERLPVSPALFWPTTDEHLGDRTAAAFAPSWPNLETVTVLFAPLDSYHIAPLPERGLQQLMVAAGQAVHSEMPRLQRLYMEHHDVDSDVALSLARHPRCGDPFHLDWHSEPPVPLTEEVLRTWGLEREGCREDWDKDDPPDWYTLSAVVPWR